MTGSALAVSHEERIGIEGQIGPCVADLIEVPGKADTVAPHRADDARLADSVWFSDQKAVLEDLNINVDDIVRSGTANTMRPLVVHWPVEALGLDKFVPEEGEGLTETIIKANLWVPSEQLARFRNVKDIAKTGTGAGRRSRAGRSRALAN